MKTKYKKQKNPDCKITDVDNFINDGYYDINFTKIHENSNKKKKNKCRKTERKIIEFISTLHLYNVGAQYIYE